MMVGCFCYLFTHTELPSVIHVLISTMLDTLIQLIFVLIFLPAIVKMLDICWLLLLEYMAHLYSSLC